ncbi:MAG: alpha-glucuronidase family glycosyl hydrolase [Amphiplicatus sp.]
MKPAPLASFFACLILMLTPAAQAEDGYDLWLRYKPVEKSLLADYRKVTASLVVKGDSPTLAAARDELARGVKGMLGREVSVSDTMPRNGAILIGTPETSPEIAGLDLPLDQAGAEGFVIRAMEIGGRRAIVIAGNSEIGVLYGAFEFLRQMQTGQAVGAIDIVSAPKIDIRMLDHWDNLNGFIERGYAGASLWDWQKLPEYLDPRYTDYARANASIGINGAALNNVNANASILTPLYLEKAAALANVFRPYGIKVYLSARFSAPIEIGGLKTADPLDPKVQAWWKAKADEIYEYIPDFGGFLVKANSEGQPGPQDYGRTHADGANMLADAVAPHDGVVMWRAFVYSNEVPDDRVKQAYNEFVPLDGEFRDNVLIQVKNGPLDFQPREPFHPLFGATPETPLMMEFQLTKEYLGFETHLVYLGALYEEVLETDTYAKGEGSTIAKVIDGSLFGNTRTGIAGVANTGGDRNWSGSVFDQANWYAYGRLAWDPEASSRDIAADWARMTFTADPDFVGPVVDMMMKSREAVVNYMTPLGLTHAMATGHHYGPGPWVDDAGRADWNPVYYHRADARGIGFDRTASGSNAVAQYAEPLAKRFSDLETTPDNLLLWFHHVPWDYRMKSGEILWNALVERYDLGVQEVAQMRESWAALEPFVDAERFAETAALLEIQEKEAQWWRDASIAYFQSISKLPLPDGVEPPPHSLNDYKAIKFPHLTGY